MWRWVSICHSIEQKFCLIWTKIWTNLNKNLNYQIVDPSSSLKKVYKRRPDRKNNSSQDKSLDRLAQMWDSFQAILDYLDMFIFLSRESFTASFAVHRRGWPGQSVYAISLWAPCWYTWICLKGWAFSLAVWAPDCNSTFTGH